MSSSQSRVTVQVIQSPEDLKRAFEIREEVFVIEQEVAPEEEYDEFEDSSRHFLALLEGKAIGTARWRKTANGVKLERFAVRKEARNAGAGAALVAAVVQDVAAQVPERPLCLYMHAQLPAMSLYARHGFQPKGDLFIECDIEHYKMELFLSED